MPTSHPSPTNRSIIHGSGTAAFGIAATLALVGVLICVWNPHAWLILAVFFTGAISFFSMVGAHRRMTTMGVDTDHLVLTSWFDTRRISLADLDSLSLRTTMIGRSLAHSIVCWNSSGKEVAEIDTTPFSRRCLRDVLTIVQQDHPQLRIDRELQRFLDLSW